MRQLHVVGERRAGATRDIFRRFSVDSATIRYAVVGGNWSNVTVSIVTDQIG